MRNRRRLGTGERGATLAEYALVVALLAVVVLAAVTLLGRESDDGFDEVATATDGGTPGGGGGGGGTPGGGGGGLGGGGGGGGTTPTTSESTPTTSAPTTSTTAAPTTTTAAPPSTTTTTMPPLGPGYPSDSGFREPTVTNSGNTWSASTRLVVRSSDGTPLAGSTATVEIRRRQRSGNAWVWTTQTVQVTTGSDGTVSVSSGTYLTNGSTRVSDIEFRLVSAGAGWDGHQGTASAAPD